MLLQPWLILLLWTLLRNCRRKRKLRCSINKHNDTKVWFDVTAQREFTCPPIVERVAMSCKHFPHGMPTTLAETINADLLEFTKA